MNPKISAIICTHNRAKYLKKAIKSLLDQTLPKKQYEIIIIDNKSTDNTKNIVQKFSKIKNLRYIFEPVLGISQARNTGWEKAKGKYIAYLDDDAIAPKQWLQKIIGSFRTIKPKPSCIGGKVEPIWQSPKPRWLPDELLPSLTIVDWSKKIIRLDSEKWIVSTNMALPKKVLEEIGGFPVDLGRKGSSLRSGEDIEIVNSIIQKGYSCFYNPEISVKHHVPKSRLTKKWFLKRTYWNGISEAILHIKQNSFSKLEKIYKAGAMAKMLIIPKNIFVLLKPTNNPCSFYKRCIMMWVVGYILGMLGIKK